jgi:UDP:flavonoid glycosyltransferase YjiC (YdhE family)
MRIVLASWGSYGDVYPYLGIALALKARGHRPLLAMPGYYREMVEGAGIEFHAMRPDIDPDDKAWIASIMDPRRGAERLLREVIVPHVGEAYADLEAAIDGADLLVSHPVTFAVPLLAEKRGLRWVSTNLAPLVFFSAHEMPVLPPAPWTVHLARLGPWVPRLVRRLARRITAGWFAPVHALRRELGLPPGGHPLFEGQFSPWLTLALFSKEIGAPQPDWPPNTVATGFAFYNGPDALSPELQGFLAAGPAPIVFTLGSSAVLAAGRFYHESAAALALLGRRGVLMVGPDPANLPSPLPEGVIAVEMAPHQLLFPHAAAVVHQGGIGTTSQAMRAGKPTLVVPHAHDQPDNAWRLEQRGISLTLYPKRYRADRVAAALRELLGDSGYAERAAAIGSRLRAEDGITRACEALERIGKPGTDHG